MPKIEEGDGSMRIAICDDEPFFRSTLYNVLIACDELPKDVSIEEFDNGHALIKSHEESNFDIIFLDIEMPEISGMEVGQKIRDNDKNAIIIMVTSHRRYMQKSFRIDVFDYIVKPYEDSDIHDVFERAIKKYRNQRHKITFNSNGEMHTLDVGDIVYIMKETRRLKIVTLSQQTYECYGGLNYYEQKLSPYGFLRSHKGFLVNMNHIITFEADSIITVLGTDYYVYLSTRKRKECLDIFSDFITTSRI